MRMTDANKVKNIHFMAGFPRSGSTLLTSLLNQNPDIYASHNSNVQLTMNNLMAEIPNYESVTSGYRVHGYNQVVKNIVYSYYEDLPQKVIIDKSRQWCTLYGLELAKKITPDVKIIFPVRPILEVLASFIKLAESNSDNYIDRLMREQNFWPSHYRPINDARCDWLMKNEHPIDAALFGYSLSQKEEYKNMFHLVHYDNLCADPQEELNKIYSFLGIEKYNHNFENIDNKEVLDDKSVFGIPSLHVVRQQITKTSVRPEEILSEYVIEKYKNTMSSLENR